MYDCTGEDGDERLSPVPSGQPRKVWSANAGLRPDGRRTRGSNRFLLLARVAAFEFGFRPHLMQAPASRFRDDGRNRSSTCNLGQDFPANLGLKPPACRYPPGRSRTKFVMSRGAYPAASVDGSIFTPGPCVEATETRFTNVPFAPDGLALCTASAKARIFSASASSENEALPTPAWTMPAFPRGTPLHRPWLP